MTSLFDLIRSFLHRLSVNIFRLSLSVEKLFNIFIWLENSPFRVKFVEFLVILNPLTTFGETATPESDYLTPTALFEPSNGKSAEQFWSVDR
jgi:hypothetical protein